MKKLLFILCVLMCINTTAFANNFIYDENNSIVGYSAPYNGADSFVLPVVSKNIALNIAQNFISTHCPEITGELNMDNCYISYNKSYPYGYNITFPRIIGGIEYSQDNVTLFIDSNTGEVVNFSKNFNNSIVPEDYTSVIGITEALQQYKLSHGLHLQYNKKIIDNKIETYLTYTADDLIINAVTGNVISIPYTIPSGGYFDVTYTAEKVSEYVDDGTSLSITEADKIVRGISELGITYEYSISSVNYLKNRDDTFLISITYQHTSGTKEVTLNAKTGMLIEYTDNTMDITLGSVDQTDAEKFAEKHYSSYIGNSVKKANKDDEKCILLYERLVNDIPYKSNGVYIYINNGKLKNVSFAWDNVEFEPANDIISYDDAYAQLFDKCGLELGYYKRDNNQLTPVYQLAETGTGIIDAKSGKQLNYDGSLYYAPKKMNYIDINSHYSGDIANKMSDCDIYVSSGHVFLGDYITQQEFLLLICELIDGTKPVLSTTGVLTEEQSEMLYAYMFANNIMDRSEADSVGYVTRADAVKYFLRILGYGTVGDMSDIFIRHFNDYDSVSEKLVGYIELARSMGIVNGAGDGRFKPKEFITNGDSLIIMYNYLKG